MTSIPYCSIAFVARSEFRLLMLEVMREVQRRYRTEFHLFCFGPEEQAFYEARNEDGAFSSITNAEILLSSTRTMGLNEAEVFARAAKLKKPFLNLQFSRFRKPPPRSRLRSRRILSSALAFLGRNGLRSDGTSL
jgi:hypothetical protein